MMKQLRLVGAGLVAVLALCGSAAARLTSTGTPALTLTGITTDGFTASLSDSSWLIDSCSGTATFPDGTVNLDGTGIFGDSSSADLAYVNAPVNEIPSSITISCKVEQDGVYVGTKTVWHSQRRIKAAARYWERSRTCAIHSTYYSTLTISCLGSPAGWVKWYQPLWKGEQVQSAWVSWNRLLSTSRPYFTYRFVAATLANRRSWGSNLKGFVVETLPVAAGRIVVVNSLSVIVRSRVKVPRYGNIYDTTGGDYNVNIPACSAVQESYSGSGDVTEPSFTTCKNETLSWTLTNDIGCGMFVNDDGEFTSLVDSSDSSGTTTLSAGDHILDVVACGDWTISVG